MREKQFYFAQAPAGIKPIAEPLSFIRRGADAHGAYPDSIALSKDWNVTVQGDTVPVYAVPVTRCGPHSFCRLELSRAKTQTPLCLHFSGPLHAVSIVPDHPKQLRWVQQESSVLCFISGPCCFTVQVNERMYSPLTVVIELPQQNVPRADDPKVLWYGPGLHLVSSIEMRSGQTLYLAPGAILKAVQPKAEEPAFLEQDWAGVPNYKDFISAENCSDIRICGRGIIDLSALDWHARRTMCFLKCKNIIVDGPTLLGAAHWTVALFECESVLLQNLILFGHRENSDGIDLVNCCNATVRNCYIRTGDDAICIKAMKPSPIVGGENILVENCIVWNDKVRGIGIAGESRGEIHHVVFRRCTVLHSLADWAAETGALCVVLCDSGTVHDVVFEDIEVLDERANGINCMLFRDRWSTDTTAGHIQDITFRNICLAPNTPLRFWGYDQNHLVKNITLENVTMEDSGPLWLDCNAFAKKINVQNSEP